ncbi:MAG: nuclease-related domain-containing protein [Jatrophihabitantaceae bacterium]
MTDTTEDLRRYPPGEPARYVGRHARPRGTSVSPRHVLPDREVWTPRHLLDDADTPSLRTLSARVEIARRLATLGAPWRVLHAVPIGDRAVDHLVIGPAGVFTIDTKHHPGAKIVVRGDSVTVDGADQPYVATSRDQARQAAELLSARALFDVDVRALVAVFGAPGGFTVKAQAYDGVVNVLTRKEIVPHLWSSPEVLGAPSIERIYEVARELAA